jgi:hypothetical protein
MEKYSLEMIVSELEELETNLYLAERTRDKRSWEKRVREAKIAIADYTHSLPSEVLGYLDTHVATNALNYQWVRGDIGRCIKALKVWIDSISDPGSEP